MAIIECALRGNFNSILDDIEHAATSSLTAQLENCSDFRSNGCRCAVRVYERYSWSGGNRVSLSITLLQAGDDIFLSAIASGGSQAMFFKLNTWGEESFLDTIRDAVSKYLIE